MQKIQILALAVTMAGAAAGMPREAHAIYVKRQQYCCEYRQVVQWGVDRVLNRCCHDNGCSAGPDGCFQVP